jgi:hypothetical protein
MLMHLATGLFLLGVMHARVHVAFHCPIAPGGVGIQSAPRLDREVSGLWHRRDGQIPDGPHHDRSLAAHPGDDRGPIFVVMTTTGVALLAAPTRSAAQRLLPPVLCLSLLPGGMIEVITIYDILCLP